MSKDMLEQTKVRLINIETHSGFLSEKWTWFATTVQPQAGIYSSLVVALQTSLSFIANFWWPLSLTVAALKSKPQKGHSFMGATKVDFSNLVCGKIMPLVCISVCVEIK